MSETPETPLQILQNGQGRFCMELEKINMELEKIIEARNAEVLKSVRNLRRQRAELERERDEARRELDGIISCIEQAIDFHQVHHQSYEAAAIRNLLENINQRRTKYENREL